MKISLGAGSAGRALIDVMEAHPRAGPDLCVSNPGQPGFHADPGGSAAWRLVA